MNGYAESVLATLAKLQPGGVLAMGAIALYMIFGIDRNVNANALSIALMQRDVQALTERVNEENETTVNVDLHQEQIESIHFRIGEMRNRLEKLEDE